MVRSVGRAPFDGNAENLDLAMSGDPFGNWVSGRAHGLVCAPDPSSVAAVNRCIQRGRALCVWRAGQTGAMTAPLYFPHIEPRRQAMHLYLSGVQDPSHCGSCWRPRKGRSAPGNPATGWDDIKPIDRVDFAIEARMCQLIAKEVKPAATGQGD